MCWKDVQSLWLQQQFFFRYKSTTYRWDYTLKQGGNCISLFRVSMWEHPQHKTMMHHVWKSALVSKLKFETHFTPTVSWVDEPPADMLSLDVFIQMELIEVLLKPVICTPWWGLTIISSYWCSLPPNCCETWKCKSETAPWSHISRAALCAAWLETVESLSVSTD